MSLFPICSHLAKDPEGLKAIGVTHIVNCAQGKKLNQVDTDQAFFESSGIKYHGFVATDILTFKMTPHFQAAADFIDEALNSGGKLSTSICMYFLQFECRLIQQPLG